MNYAQNVRPIVPPEDLAAEQDFRWRPSGRDSAASRATTGERSTARRRRKPQSSSINGDAPGSSSKRRAAASFMVTNRMMAAGWPAQDKTKTNKQGNKKKDNPRVCKGAERQSMHARGAPARNDKKTARQVALTLGSDQAGRCRCRSRCSISPKKTVRKRWHSHSEAIERAVADAGHDAVLLLEGAGVVPTVLLAADGQAQPLEAAHQRRGVDHVREAVKLLRGGRTSHGRGRGKGGETTRQYKTEYRCRIKARGGAGWFRAKHREYRVHGTPPPQITHVNMKGKLPWILQRELWTFGALKKPCRGGRKALPSHNRHLFCKSHGQRRLLLRKEAGVSPLVARDNTHTCKLQLMDLFVICSWYRVLLVAIYLFARSSRREPGLSR